MREFINGLGPGFEFTTGEIVIASQALFGRIIHKNTVHRVVRELMKLGQCREIERKGREFVYRMK